MIVTINTEINQYVSIQSSCCTETVDGDNRKKSLTIPEPKDARCVSLYPYNWSQIWEYVKNT